MGKEEVSFIKRAEIVNNDLNSIVIGRFLVLRHMIVQFIQDYSKMVLYVNKKVQKRGPTMNLHQNLKITPYQSTNQHYKSYTYNKKRMLRIHIMFMACINVNMLPSIEFTCWTSICTNFHTNTNT